MMEPLRDLKPLAELVERHLDEHPLPVDEDEVQAIAAKLKQRVNPKRRAWPFAAAAVLAAAALVGVVGWSVQQSQGVAVPPGAPIEAGDVPVAPEDEGRPAVETDPEPLAREEVAAVEEPTLADEPAPSARTEMDWPPMVFRSYLGDPPTGMELAALEREVERCRERGCSPKGPFAIATMVQRGLSVGEPLDRELASAVHAMGLPLYVKFPRRSMPPAWVDPAFLPPEEEPLRTWKITRVPYEVNARSDAGRVVKVFAVDAQGGVVKDAKVMFHDEQDPHPVNVETGTWQNTRLYLPDGSEKVFHKGDRTEVMVSSPSQGVARVAFEVRRKNEITVVLGGWEDPGASPAAEAAMGARKEWAALAAVHVESPSAEQEALLEAQQLRVAELARAWVVAEPDNEVAMELCTAATSVLDCDPTWDLPEDYFRNEVSRAKNIVERCERRGCGVEGSRAAVEVVADRFGRDGTYDPALVAAMPSPVSFLVPDLVPAPSWAYHRPMESEPDWLPIPPTEPVGPPVTITVTTVDASGQPIVDAHFSVQGEWDWDIIGAGLVQSSDYSRGRTSRRYTVGSVIHADIGSPTGGHVRKTLTISESGEQSFEVVLPGWSKPALTEENAAALAAWAVWKAAAEELGSARRKTDSLRREARWAKRLAGWRAKEWLEREPENPDALILCRMANTVLECS